jgi:hypothetical protein
MRKHDLRPAAITARVARRQFLRGGAGVVVGAALPAWAAPAGVSAPVDAPPVYPTRLPAAVSMEYALSYGMISGSGWLSWQPPLAGRYRMQLVGRALGLQLIEWTSEGGVDAAGLAPWRFTEKRLGRDPQVAEFRREAGRIHYPARPERDVALPRGAQDRLSWLVQLPAILRADPALQRPGQRVALFVSGARGDAERWEFETRDAGAGMLHVQRLPPPGAEVQGEAWLAPGEDLLPVRVRLAKDGDVLEMRRRS